MPIAQSLDHFVVPVDDLVVAEEFYVQVFDGDITKRNGLNTRQRKRGAVPHTFIQIGGKRMGVYLQSETRPKPNSPRGLPTYSFTTTERGLDELAKTLKYLGVAFDGPVSDGHSFAKQSLFFTDPAGNHYSVYTPTDSKVREPKNERTVVWYAPMNRESLRQFTDAFEADYPFLKVEVLTGGPQSFLNRILTEQRAGKHYYDILNVRSSALYTLKKANTVMRYDTPNRRALRAGFTDREGYLNGIWASLLVYLYNAKQVPRAQAPKSIDDLLQPRWKGKLGMDKDADDWLAAIMDYYGDEKGKQIARSLGAQQLNIRKGRTLISQLVAAGEFPVQIDAHHHEAVALKKAGAPIDYLFPEPFVPVKAVSMLALSLRPPHPYAAALLIDFMLSRKGQEMAYRQNRWPAHRELAPGGPDEVGSRKTLVPDSEKWGARFEELVQLTGLLER